MAQTVTMPISVKRAVSELNGIDALLRAKEWHRAAIVATFVELSPNQAHTKSRMRVSTVEFAAFGIAGLRTADTVRTYVQRWLDANDGVHPEPGKQVRLPDLEWPPSRTGTDGYDSRKGAAATIDRIIAQHGPSVLAPIVAQPAVALAVLTDPLASLALIKARADIDSSRPIPQPSPGGGLAGAMQKGIIQIAAMAVADDADKLRQALVAHIKDATAWRPNEEAQVMTDINRAMEALRDCKAMLTPVTDQGLAEFLGQ